MRKKILVVLLSLAMVLSMTGCSTKKAVSTDDSSKDTASTEEATASNEDASTTDSNTSDSKWEYKEATLTFLIDSDVSLDGFNAVAALAKEKLGITIETELRAGGADGDNLVKTRLASGDMCDIMGYNSGSLLAALNPSEYFIDISQYDWASRLDDTYKATVTVDNQTFGVPMTSSQAGAVLYNKEMYAKYNLSVPKTWDEFVNNCKVLKDAGETAVLGAFGDSWTSQVLFLGDYYNVLSLDPDFTTGFQAGNKKYATSDAGLSSFKKYEDLKGYYNEDYLSTTYDDVCDMMANGEGAHWFMLTQALSNIYSLYDKETVDKIGVFGIPGDNADDQGLTVWMPTSIYGNKNSDKQADILRFMEFYTSDEALDAMVQAQLPDGPYCIKGYQLPDNTYAGVKDMQTYFDAGKTRTAQEFQTSVKGSNCPSICQEVASGQVSALDAAKEYDKDCYKQAIQLGLDWKE